MSTMALEVLERDSEASALVNVPATIARLQSEAAILSVTSSNGNPSTTVVDLGRGFVDLSAFREAAASLNGQAENQPARALVRTPGWADLKVVRQKIKRYEMGEVAHIENVLQGEHKERTHRRKTATETTILVETERTEENEQDLQSTERFELQREATQTAHEDSRLETGLTVTASGPFLEVTANAGYTLNRSKDESSRQATSYARDVTERSVTRIQERVREQRTTRTLTEVEETNKHGVDNSEGEEHVVGIYRWVEKVYEAQVFDYGKRMLLEFNIPEPAAFFKHALANPKVPEGITAEKPLPPVVVEGNPHKPKSPIKRRELMPTDITPDNYLTWVQQYKVKGVDPPPALYETATWVHELPVKEDEKPTDGEQEETLVKWEKPELQYPSKATKELQIPKGYQAKSYFITLSRHPKKVVVTFINTSTFPPKLETISVEIVDDANLTWTVGTSFHTEEGIPDKKQAVHFAGRFPLDNEKPSPPDPALPVTGSLPVAVTWGPVVGFAATVSVLCERTPEALEKWQLQTYEKIMEAYYELENRYNEQIAAAAARQGIGIAGRNPNYNREIEKAELKKATISLMRGGRFEDFDAIYQENAPGKLPYPEIHPGEAREEGRLIQFFEQAFEWPQMIYTFYPYFWGRKELWIETSQLDDPDDPIFASFLRAGAARVVVPVRRGFEKLVSFYLATDQIWGGGEPPAVGSELYLSLAQEIREQQDADSGGIPEGDTWEVRLPTTLAILQQDAELPVFSRTDHSYDGH